VFFSAAQVTPVKLTKKDYFSQLIATGNDLVGAVTVKLMEDRCPITYELCGTDKYSEKDSNDSS
jgi:hypothetical protein